MKKIKALSIALLMVVFGLSLTLTQASANPSDLYDDVSMNQSGYHEIELLENSSYQINIIKNDVSTNKQDFLTEFNPMATEFSFEFASNSFNSGIIGGNDTWWGSTFDDMSWTFDTTTAETMELYLNGSSEQRSALYPYMEIEILWLGNTEPVDNVAPEYTYSNVEIDTPYYDLVTVSEVQAQLQAVDDEDGDVSDRIQVYDDQYTSITPKVVGDEYFIMFMVDDTSGNAAYLRVDINVIDDLKPQLENGQQVYSDGASFDFSWYDDEYSELADEIESFLYNSSIIDDYYGSVSFNDSTAISDGWVFNGLGDYGMDLGSYRGDIPGTYTLIHEAIDPSGNKLTFTFNVTVLTNANPVINGSDTLDMEVTDFTDLNDVLPYYTASDAEDGAVSVEILTSYTIDSGEAAGQTETYDYSWVFDPAIGSYDVHLKATDSLGAMTTRTITLNLVDTTAPNIKVDGIDSTNYAHTVYMSDTTSLQALIDTITASDLYDGDLTSSIVVPAFPSFSVPGNHTLNVTVTDASSNQATLSIDVTVADDIPPVINGATKIVKGLSETLTLSDILAELTVTDNIDSNLTLQLVSDTYTGNSSNIGSYLVKYKATDTAGNITYRDVRIWVVDNQAPAWIINDYFVNLSINESMTRAELVTLLQDAGMIGTDISGQVTFLVDEYTGNEENQGAYQVVMNITYDNGSEEQIAVQMNVPEPQSEDVIVIDPVENQTGLQKFWTGVIDTGKWITNLLVDIFYEFMFKDVIKPAYEWIFVKNPDIVPVDLTTEEETTTEHTGNTLPYTTDLTAPVYEI